MFQSSRVPRRGVKVAILGMVLGILIVLLTQLLVFGQTAETPAENEQPAIALDAEPTILDPLQNNDPTVAFAAWQLYDALLTVDEDGNPEPALATSVTFVSNTATITYTFALTTGVTFHDGTQFEADSVVFSWERGSTLHLTPWDYVHQVKALDQFTVQVTTPIAVTPEEFLAEIVPALIMRPRRPLTQEAEDQFNKEPKGTGPYKFVRWLEPGVAFEIEPNPIYWGKDKATETSHVFFRYAPPGQRVAALQANQIAVFNLSLDERKIIVDDIPQFWPQYAPQCQFSYGLSQFYIRSQTNRFGAFVQARSPGFALDFNVFAPSGDSLIFQPGLTKPGFDQPKGNFGKEFILPDIGKERPWQDCIKTIGESGEPFLPPGVHNLEDFLREYMKSCLICNEHYKEDRGIIDAQKIGQKASPTPRPSPTPTPRLSPTPRPVTAPKCKIVPITTIHNGKTVKGSRRQCS